MTKYDFFEAFGEIDFPYILAVDGVLKKADSAVIPFSRRKVLRIALIAAVLAGLLTITAYAAGLFGLQSRLIHPLSPAGQTHGLPDTVEEILDNLRTVYYKDYISLSGVAGSIEYQASAEWLAFKGTYTEQRAAAQLEKDEGYFEWRDLERSFAADDEEREICRLYQVWDKAMWSKLQEIAEKYGLQLHTSRSPLPGDTREHGVYEDGSFIVSIQKYDSPIVFYDVYAERRGSLPADGLIAVGTDRYEEWEYTNAYDNMLSIAVKDVTQDELWPNDEILIFYNSEDITVTVKTGYSHRTGDGTDSKATAEAFADTIDFAAAIAAGTPDEIIAILKGVKP